MRASWNPACGCHSPSSSSSSSSSRADARAALRTRSALGRDLGAVVVQILVATGVVTAMTTASTALLGVLPTPATLDAFLRLATQAVEEIRVGVAPLATTTSLSAVIIAGFAVLTVLLDQLVAMRTPLPAILLIVVIGALPTVIAFGDADLIWFVAFAALVALLLWQSSGRKNAGGGEEQGAGTSRQAPILLTAGAAAVTLLLTFLLVPALPLASGGGGLTTSSYVDPTLRLGEDLRRPSPSEVMTFTTDASSAPYLRLSTFSGFTGSVWTPDEDVENPLDDGFGAADWTDDVTVQDQRTTISITGLSSSWLPVPYAAQGIEGLSGDWNVLQGNRTVTSDSADASGQDYTVDSLAVRPSLEQIRAASVSAPDAGDFPDDLPATITSTAASVTQDATNPYDKLIALQDWFRTSFEYSLDAPVEDDFDGTGVDAVVKFLEVRAGYCIHFAGAFALMAESLDMPVRIVVGYLPGQRSGGRDSDGNEVYSVRSDQLHAWPEVHFEGIGWVPFEPTASLGSPTAFQPSSGSDDEESATPSTTPSDTPAPTATQTTAAEQQQTTVPEANGTQTTQTRVPVALWIVLVVLLVLCVPALLRIALSVRRRARARRGDALGAWQELRATMLDLSLPVSAADTPRQRGATAVAHGADATAIATLVDAVERASFSRVPSSGSRPPLPDGDLPVLLDQVTRELYVGSTPVRRALARFLPRSLSPFLA